MDYLFNLSYWFNARPGSLSPKALIFFAIFLVSSLAMILVFYVLSKRKSLFKRIWKRLQAVFLANFFIGLVYFFFAYELIPLLSARFWILLWVLGILAWLYFISIDLRKVPKIKEKAAEENEYKKYIP